MRRRRAVIAALIAGALGATAAWAFPWDVDMVDGATLRAFEWRMMTLPDGVVSRNMYRPPADRMTPEGQALQSPFEADAATAATGKRMFEIYCAACHGTEGKGGAPVADMSGGKKRYPMPPPKLSGPGNVPSLRSDGYLFLTIRNGGAIMPSYSFAMSDDEIWAVVGYVRTLEGTAYSPPPPADAPAAPEGAP